MRRPAMSDALGDEAAATSPPNTDMVTAGHNGVSLGHERPARRRKVRKGTRSCWECKRRKTRCIFASPDDSTCFGCQRRRTVCVSQEMPEELSPARKGNRHLGERIARVEDFMKGFLSSKDVSVLSHNEGEPRHARHLTPDTPTGRSDDSESSTVRAPPANGEVRRLATPSTGRLFLTVT